MCELCVLCAYLKKNQKVIPLVLDVRRVDVPAGVNTSNVHNNVYRLHSSTNK